MKIQIQKIYSKSKLIPLILFGMIAVAAVAWACGWSPTTRHSVRFNSYASEKEFIRLPPLPYQVELKTGKTIKRQEYDEEEYEDDEKYTSEIEEIWSQAGTAEMNGDYTNEAKLLREYLQRTTYVRDYYFGPKHWQERRNTAFDKLDALSALKQGSKADAVKSYLEARQKFYEASIVISTAQEQSDTKIYEAETSVTELLEKGTTDRNLKDNFAYLRAAVLYQEQKLNEAQNAFDAVAYLPNSEKREVASFMAAVCAMKQSSVFVATSGDDAHRNENWNSKNKTEETPPENSCCDEAWSDAKSRFTKYLKAYPQGRYSNNSRGWLAHLYLRKGDRAQALAEYYRMLGQQTDANARVEAVVSLSLSRPHATEAEMDQVELLLANEPAAGLAYAYYNIYNYAIDPRCPMMDFYPGENESQSEVNKKRLSKENIALARVTKFATQMMQRYPHSKVSGNFALRVAQANLEIGDNSIGRKLAQKALELGVSGEEREQALMARGFAENRMKDFATAHKTFSNYISSYPQGEFSEDAHRLLAMTAEDLGNLDEALEHYLALDYWQDVAYFIDVLLKPEQLAHFIAKHPNLKERDDLLYALGLRYLRDEKWKEARGILVQVKTVKCEKTEDRFSSYGQQKINPKYDMHPLENSAGNICDCWVQKDLQTGKELESLKAGIELANGDEATAEAMYQYASHQYESSRLSFYNPAAWHLQRHDLLEEISPRAINETSMLLEYSQKHEPIARALPIYLEIVKRYPATKAARDALFTSVVIHQRLSEYNNYWRDIYGQGLHAGERLVTFADLKSTYPKYRLPRGSDGWEASTRTVNGGPGWAAPPKPLPKLTRSQKFKRYLKRFGDFFQSKIQSKIDSATESYTTYLWRFLTAILIAVSLIFTWYGSVLSFHFWQQRKPLLPVELSILSTDDLPFAETSDSESRVEKIINDSL
jgi:TolA-binding protein